MKAMKIFLCFSGGHSELAKTEATALSSKVLEEGKGFLVADFDPRLLERLTLTRLAGKLLARTENLDKLCLPGFKSFAVRCTKINDAKVSCRKVEEKVGSLVKGSVDLEKPETVVRVFCVGKKFFVTEELFEYSEKRFSCRQVNARPFFHPTSLQPKWARLLVNLSGVKTGVVLDPFCGAGGVLLESGDMGLKAVGVDKDETMVEGARENLWFFRLENRCKVDQADFLEWTSRRSFDAVVTDLPYGRSSKLFGKKLEGLYEKAFKKMHEHSPRLVVMGPKDLSPMLSKTGWTVKSKYSVYVHKTLKRWIHQCLEES
jgi:tRNA (guanine10-N2)-dimethyltransferase